MYNWNKIFVGYCDGGSFSGRSMDPVQVPGHGEGVMVHYGGSFILDAVYDMFLEQHKMKKASEVVISGSSAGGLAVMLHIDYLHHKISTRATNSPLIIGLVDGGYFMDVPSLNGEQTFNQIYKDIYATQNVSINQKCVKEYAKDQEGYIILNYYFLLLLLVSNVLLFATLKRMEMFYASVSAQVY